MMLTIHGLPRTTKYHDLKVLIKQECNITDFILDSLLVDNDGTKKVRIGVTDDSDGTHLMKCLNGYRMSGHILKVMPVGKSALMNTPNQNVFDQRAAPYNQPRNDFPNQEPINYAHPGNHSVQEPIPGRPGPWVSNTHWVPNEPMAPPMQQSSYNYQQPTSQNVMPSNMYMQQQQPQAHRMPAQDPGLGFQPKNNPRMSTMGSAPRRVEERGHTLRSVQLVDTSASEHYPSHGHQHDKPIPPQYNMGLPDQTPGHYQAQGHGQVHPQVQGHPSQVHSQGPNSLWAQQQQKPQPFAKPNPAASYEKAPTIMKNIQDPMRSVHDNYKEYDKSGRFSPQRRISPGRKSSPTGRRISPGAGPGGRRMPSPGRRHSPPRRRISPSGHGYSASKRNASPPARRISPNDRRMSHSLDRRESSPRRMSPGRRPVSPGRRPISPGRRPISPGRRQISPGKRMTSPGRRPGSPGRRPVSPNRRPGSPGRRPGSPGRRPGSPGRRPGPILRRPGSPDKRDTSGQLRYSPTREYQDKMANKYQEGRSSGSKQIRPAYDQSQAPNQAMYSGGYRPDVHEIVQYPVPGARVDQRNPPWQQERDKAMYAATMKKDGDRRDSRPNFDRNVHITEETKRSSRSPIRRERSPVRDRYKRQSPSPHSPRRSWALEKRRSPDAREAPPPPVWPGQNLRDDNKFSRDSRPNFQDRNEKGDKSKRMPVWDRPSFDEKDVSRNEPRSEVAEQKFGNQIRIRTDLQVKQSHREPSPRGHRYKAHDDRFPQQSQRDPPKFSSQEFHYADVPERSPYLEKADYRDFSPINKDRHDDNFPPRREVFQRRPEEREGGHNQSTNFDKEFDDIHKRALDFHKRVEEFRRGDSRKKGEHVIEDRSRRNEADRETDERRPERYKPFSDIDEDTRHRNDSTRQGFRHQDEHGRRDLREELKKQNREPEWKFDERPAKKMNLNTSLKAKRDKAAEEITQKILKKHHLNLKGDLERRVIEELKLTVSRVILEMFGEQDPSYIEIIVKFDSKYGGKGEDKLLEEVMSSFPSQYRNLKRRAPGSTEISPKTIRRSPDAKKDNNPGSNRLASRTKIASASSGLSEKWGKTELTKKQLSKVLLLEKKQNSKFVSQKKTIIKPEPQKKQTSKTVTKEEQVSKIEPKKVQVSKIETKQPKVKHIETKKEQVSKNENKPISKPTLAPVTNISKVQDSKIQTKQAPVSNDKTKKEQVSKKCVENKPISSAPGSAEPRKEKTVNSEEKKQNAKTEDTITEEKVEQVSSTAPSVDPAPDGHYELNPRMTRMLDAELQHIMIKIWQDLPDDPPTEAEKLVADMFRNKAGDEIRNVLGLNVTKRLLNIHNPLYVKIHFSGKPEPGRLKMLLKKYNICAFKRLDKPLNTFAAQLRTFADFDNICTAKDLRCGSAKLKITPCYKFIKCPEKLRTPYVDDELEEEEDKNKTMENIESASDNKNDNNDQKSPIKNAPTPNAENIVTDKLNTEATKETVSKQNESSKIKTENKPETKNKNEDNKISNPNNTNKNKAVNIKTVTKTQNVKKTSNDDEEMTDEDIFALLSGNGIVLDECSGSDDE